MKLRTCPKGCSENIVVRVISNETYVRNLSLHQTYHLDWRAASVWQLCDGTKTVDEIKRILSAQNVDESTVSDALTQLASANLLNNHLETHDKAISRRNIFKSLGLASLAILFGNLFSACSGSDSEVIRAVLPSGGGAGPLGGTGSSGQGAPTTGYIFGGPDAGKPTTVLVTYVSTKTTSNTPENAANCMSRAQTGCNSKSARLDCFAEGHTCYCVCN